MVALTIDDCAASRAPGRLVRRIDRIMYATIEARFPEDALSFSQWITLKLMHDGIVRTPGELARDLGHTTGAVTRLIDALEERGLLQRARNGADRRSVHLLLTDRGREEMERLGSEVIGIWNEVLADFDRDEFETLIRLLHKLLYRAERLSGADAVAPALVEA